MVKRKNSVARMIAGSLLGTVLTCSGCAVYNQVLINAEGHEVYCDTVGTWIVGSCAAGDSFYSCVNSRRAAGYIEVEKAGAIGATFNEQGYVLRLVAGGPAATADGLKVNDQVVAVNGVTTNNGREIRALLFIRAGAHVVFRVKRDGGEKDVTLTARSWSAVNGFKSVNDPGVTGPY